MSHPWGVYMHSMEVCVVRLCDTNYRFYLLEWTVYAIIRKS